MSDVSRTAALSAIESYFDSGSFTADLARLVAVPTESQVAGNQAVLKTYLEDQIIPLLGDLGFICSIHDNPNPESGPILIGSYEEAPALPTILTYGHGDVVMGHEGRWAEDRDPWTLDITGDQAYGRGTADNKFQHLINFSALKAVKEARGRLGFNMKIIFEMDEESGSRGLREFCITHAEALAADVFIASDGPRVRRHLPTLALGSRGIFNFDMSLKLRDGARHSGNWGGLIQDPGIHLNQAIASITDERGQIRIEDWRPRTPSRKVRALLEDCPVGDDDPGSSVDEDWGEDDLTPAERVYAWNSFAVLAQRVGDPDKPINAIASEAWARCQLRFVAETQPQKLLPALREHLDVNGFDQIELSAVSGMSQRGTTVDPDNPWVQRATESFKRTSGDAPVVIPCIGGTLPNAIFAHDIGGPEGLPTIWVPHSYTGCNQHAPNEHILLPVARDALRLMTGLFWDLGES